jgi:NitT/TauT family transport system substrate-binding protein
VALLLVLVAAAGCRKETSTPAAAGPTLERVSLGLNWFPEAEHGGFYAAQVHGYFAEEGLDVEIVKGGAASPILQQVAGGERDFGVTNADNILFGRAQQAPVVALMAPLQTSPRCILVHASSGIERFDQIKNLTLAMSLENAFSHYLRKKAPLEGVQIVPYSGNVAPLLSDANYAQQGYVFSEPFVARKHGAKVNVLMLSDLGYNPYTSLLFASEKTTRERPELVRRMVRACVRGWKKYLEDPDATNARIHELNREMDLDILAFGVEQLRPLVLGEPPQPEGLGRMTLARWETLVEQLVECDQLKPGEVDPRQAFTTQFLPK